MKFTPAIFILSVFLSFMPAQAEDGPKCSQESVGTLSCMVGRQCECIYEAGGTMTGKPAGYRWDCGLNRPNCTDAANTAPVPYYSGPESVSIDNSTVKVEQAK